MTEPTKPTTKTEEKVVATNKPAMTLVAEPKTVVPMAVPDGAVPMDTVRPGYGPLEGSPKEGDPTQLANPNNPLSPVTKAQNPSNPANPPQTQSEKPASEVRIFQSLNPPVVLETQASKDRKTKLASLLKGIGDILTEFGNESAIPPGHAYWGMVQEHRVLNNP